MARILVVEDDNYLAMEMSWMIEDAGHSVVGPEASVEASRKVLARHRVDLALLDVLLGGETVFPVSRLLDRLGTPFIFVTVCAPSALPAEYRARPLFAKPCRPESLVPFIQTMLRAREGRT
jgi:DNA-binding response OmpR family regulator